MTTFAESNILSETRQEYESKVDLLCEWADAYYDKDQPVVPDSVYGADTELGNYRTLA